MKHAEINGPAETVVAGDLESIESIIGRLHSGGIDGKRLQVTHAFHSRLIEPMLDEFESVAARLTYATPGILLVSNLTGESLSIVTASHWRRHARGAVEFARGVSALAELGCRTFVEVGPQPTLTRLGQQCVADQAARWTYSLRRGQDEHRQMLAAARDLYLGGVSIDWTAVDRPYTRRRVALPTYPFQRERFWFKTSSRRPGTTGLVDADLLGRRLRSPVIEDMVFETVLGLDRMPDLDAHRVSGQPLAPAALFVELALQAAERAGLRADDSEIDGMTFEQPLTFAAGEEGDGRTVQTVLSAGDEREVRILSASIDGGDAGSEWTRHVSARFRKAGQPPQGLHLSSAAAVRADAVEVSSDEYYDSLRSRGIDIGPAFRAISRLWVGAAGAAAELSVPNDAQRGTYLIHPALFDAGCHVLGAAIARAGIGDDTFLLARIGRIRFVGPVISDVVCVGRLRENAAASAPVGDLDVLTPDGRLLLQCEGLEFRRVRAAAAALPPDWLYEISWKSLGPTGIHRSSEPGPIEVGVMSRAVAGELSRLATEPSTAAYGAALDLLERLTTAYMHAACRDLGWRPAPGESFAAAELAARLRVLPRHHRLFQRVLDILAADGIVVREGANWRVVTGLRDEPIERVRATLAADHSIVAPELELTTRCGAELAAVLRGDANPLELLFPGGSLHLAERVYEQSGASHVCNPLVERAVAAAIAQLPADRTIHVLEIGSGTGATTSRVLPLLPQNRCRYVFTDVSPAFLSRAQEKFRAFSCVDYRLFDVSRDPAAQGVSEGTFDVVLAANVLHATPDLRDTMTHARRLLAPGGVVVLVEAARRLRWLDITFGMTEGWWASRDEDLRGGHPLITGEEWTRVLASVGFADAAAVPGPAAAGQPWASQAVVMAQQPVVPGSSAEPSVTAGAWLLLADRAGVAERLAACARAAGERALMIPRPADGDAAAVERALEIAQQAPGPLRGVVHCWNLDLPANDTLRASDLVHAGHVGCASVLLLVQAMLRRSISAKLSVATRGAQPVGLFGEEVPALAQSPVWGLGRVVALEHPEIWGGTIDLDPHAMLDAAASSLWDALHVEDGEDQVAIRNRRRYGARLTRAADIAASEAGVRADGSYLVTGGSGKLGLRVARWLAAQGARHIVLTSRRPWPNRAEWTSLDTSHPMAAAVVEIADIEKSGARVTTVAADVADAEAMNQLAARFGHDLPALRGVLHLAFAQGARNIPDLNAGALDEMLRPKVLGTWVLDQAIRHCKPDFFVLFSSTTGLLGSKGLAHYAAANVFLDAFAHFRRATGDNVLSVDWGAWDAMRQGSEEQQRMFAQAGLRPMPTPKALAALGALLGSRRPQTVVAAVDWRILRAVFEARRRRPFLEDVAAEDDNRIQLDRAKGDRGSLVAALASAAPDARLDIVLARVRAEAAAVLALDPQQVDVRQGLFDMGMDSLMSVELKTRLEKCIGRSLPTTLTFNYPSVWTLAEFLVRETQPAAASSTPAATVPAQPAPAADGSVDRDDLTEEELEMLLAEKLAQIH